MTPPTAKQTTGEAPHVTGDDVPERRPSAQRTEPEPVGEHPQLHERWSCGNCGADVIISRGLAPDHPGQCTTCLSFDPQPLR